MTDHHPEESPEGQDVDGRVADATDRNWVDTYCPAWSRPWLRLSRADRPAGTWLLLLPCWWGATLAILTRGGNWTAHDLWVLVACGLGAFLMRGAGCTWNDIADRDFDAGVARTMSRPLPSGQVSVTGAYIWMAVQAGAAFLILLSFNSFAIWLGILSLVPVAIYPFAKRFTWWPQVFLGIAFNWGALWGWAAVMGGLSWAPFLLYLSGIAWTLFYDTIYAHQDREDDALIGIKSTARLFGAATGRWLFAFEVLSVSLMTFAVAFALRDASFLVLLSAISAPWAFGWHLAMQLRRLDIDDPELCLRLFRSNRDTGLIPAGVFALTTLLIA